MSLTTVSPIDLTKKEYISAYSRSQALRILYHQWETTPPNPDDIEKYIPHIYIINSFGSIIAENPFPKSQLETYSRN
jgi:hypothetical protein